MVNDMPFNKSDLIRFLRLAGRQDRLGRLGGWGTLHRIAFTFGAPIFIMQIGCFISPLQIYRVAMTNVLLLTEIFQFHLFENFFFNLQKKKSISFKMATTVLFETQKKKVLILPGIEPIIKYK